MEDCDVKRLAITYAIHAEIEGMKVDNKTREDQGLAPSYGWEDFADKAEELRNIAYCHCEQL